MFLPERSIEMRVVDVAKKLEISSDWIRRSEKAGIIPPAPRDRNGYRRYTPQLVAEIKSILFSRPKSDK
jgi:DNA-binding transcriptional MerR regulator